MQVANGNNASLAVMNDALFDVRMNRETRIYNLEEQIRQCRAQIVSSMKELASLKNGSDEEIQLNDYQLQGFFDKHPGVCFDVLDDRVSLLARNQSVYFHTKRGDEYGADINNDVVYITLPIYNFKMSFMKSGNVVGEALNPNCGLVKDCFHPHAQKSSGDQMTFSGMCQGNNHFISEYASLTCDGKLDGASFIRLMHRAVLWLTTVNIGDTYGNVLAQSTDRTTGLGNDDKNLIIRIMNGEAQSESFPLLDRAFHRLASYGSDHVLNILWMQSIMNELDSFFFSVQALECAVQIDAQMLLREERAAFEMLRNVQLESQKRADPVRCRVKLASWRSGRTGTSFREAHPELFMDL